ncbi:MAG: LysE family translocator [Ideonella sp.]|nr:LysE family translocator [Ideonella sp.]
MTPWLAVPGLDGVQGLAVFVGAGLLLNLTPGADVALIAARSAGQGARSGAAAALGVGAGCGLHALAAALGLSALVAGSPWAFAALRWAGAAYLLWLGWGMLRAAAAAQAAIGADLPPASFGRVFLQGFWTNALNPKVVMFFLAFVPQFVRPDAPHPALSFALLGIVFSVNGTLVNLGFAVALASLRQRFGGGGRWGAWLARGTGAVLIALGLKLALGDRV